MNYRHAFHAGNFADVMKHTAMLVALRHFHKKDKPFFVLDTHAGRGRYDVSADEAERTREWRDGIGRVLDTVGDGANGCAGLPEAIADYASLVTQHRAAFGQFSIPGSPTLARAQLRSGDRLHVNELHPEDSAILRSFFARDRQVVTTQIDGWQVLKAALPPKERRGLVLVDPPFEAPCEFARLASGLANGIKRFGHGVFVLWYPIKDPDAVSRFKDMVRKSIGERDALNAELIVRDPADSTRLNGSGLVIVNPPFRFQDQFEPALSWAAQYLGQDGRAAAKIVSV